MSPLYLLPLLVAIAAAGHFTNEWAVEISGDEAEAERVAKELNCRVIAKIFDDTYLLEHNHVQKRSVDPHDAVHSEVSEHPSVSWAEQQRVLSRQKRQLWRLPPPTLPPPEHYENDLNLNDERFPQMWYLNRGDRIDMNVQGAWAEGVTGKGVSITILDDGVERSHPDLQANYDPLASYDVNQNDNDPTPRYDMIDSNRHGTRCAGEVAATANNSECGVGIAYGAGIGGVRMLDGDVTDAIEARSLTLNNQHIDIFSASWGPDDDGKTVDGPGRLAARAFVQGVSTGRRGKGSIFVWASGNGGRDHDNCNCDGYTNSPLTLSVSSATENGLIPWYSEACSSTLASTYSSGSSSERKVVTTDLHHLCTSSHTGTSASAPLAAGIVALCLEANPELSWRDVQHLTVRCAHVANLKATDWAINGVGRNFSHAFGYGIMDATCMVRLAKVWKSVGEKKMCSKASQDSNTIIPGRTVAKSTVEVTDCDSGNVKFLEHVQCHVTLGASRRGDVVIYLVSPSGTRSNLIARRPKDYSRAGFNDWPFLSVFVWDESPIGTWTLEVQNDGRSVVELKKWSLSLHGIKEQPTAEVPTPGPSAPPPPPQPIKPKKTKPSGKKVIAASGPAQNIGDLSDSGLASHGDPASSVVAHGDIGVASVANCDVELSAGWCDSCKHGFLMLNGRCVAECPAERYYRGKSGRHEACIPCYYTCRTCSGSNDYQCLSCYSDAQLEEQSSGEERYCFNKSIMERVLSSSRWYYVLSVGVVVNLAIIVVLVVYIARWRQRVRSSPKNSRPGGGGGGAAALAGGYGAPVTRVGNGITKPFHDFDSSSEDGELVRKPYSDEP